MIIFLGQDLNLDDILNGGQALELKIKYIIYGHWQFDSRSLVGIMAGAYECREVARRSV